MAMNTPTLVKHVQSSAPFDFVFGRFNLSGEWSVPYFATTMSMRDAAESLRLVNDFPGNEGMGWKIDELYQRDIDWNRVEHEIVPYLSSSEEPQFFNSLTIAFMPIRENEVKPNFEGSQWDNPKIDGEFQKRLQVGPISLGYWNNWEKPEDLGARIGRIQWNTQQVFSVAIDGQHRLAALKLASKNFDEKADKTQVPVLLLLLDERVGFRAPKGHTLIELMRTLFIALNKHAESVSRPRQILLDDRDPMALCVRALIGERIIEGLAELSQGKLPLTLVDWHREQAKIDDGPYLTTILGLDWIVEQTLRTKPLKDYSSYGQVARQLRAISLALNLNLHKPNSETFIRLRELEKNAIEPFVYSGSWSSKHHDGELGEIVEAFRRTWAQGLVTVLTEFQPYQQLVNRRKSFTLSPEFTNWYYLLQRRGQGTTQANTEFANFCNQLRTRKSKPINPKSFEEELEAINALKEKNLAFKVAFQRALILAFIEFVAIGAEDLPDFDSDDEDGSEADDVSEVAAGTGDNSRPQSGSLGVTRAKQFVEGLNALIARDDQFLIESGKFKATFIWQGALYNTDGTIDFTLGASRRASDLIFLVAGLWLCKAQGDEAIDDGFDKFWDGLSDSDVGIHKKLWKRVEKKFADEKGAGGRIILAKTNQYDPGAALREAKNRARWIWDTLGMPSGDGGKRTKSKKK